MPNHVRMRDVDRHEPRFGVARLPDHSRRRRWLSRVLMTLTAWLVAFLVLLGVFTLFGEELEALPLAWRAFVMSGVLVNLMANLVMPVLIVAVGRFLDTSARPPFSGAGDAFFNERGPGRDR